MQGRKLMTYQNIKKAKFIERPNRFIAYCEINGKTEVCHVKNTGRCKELLIPGVTVYVQEANSPTRKTKYDLISVVKGDRLINIDSQAPNKVFYEWAISGKFLPDITLIKPESVFQNSRFDFYIETENKKAFVEVKGVTLEEKGVVMFPDAPTERGVKHIEELIQAKKQGYEAFIVFIVQMESVNYFTPNIKTHKTFADKLKEANKYGVKVICYDCKVSENSLSVNDRINIIL